MILLGVDTGGTFTDFVAYRTDAKNQSSIQVHKVLSTPSAPQDAILQGISDLGLTTSLRQGEILITHGTTVATNAALQGKGARTAYIANKGLKHVLRIGRQTRRELYNLTPQPTPNLFDEELLFEVNARLDAKGQVISGFEPGELAALKIAIDKLQPEAIAINLLFSFLDPSHEKEIEACLAATYFVSRSSQILPEYKEYERGITTWMNAWVGPIIHRYLAALIEQLEPSRLSMMQSSGLTISAELAATRAVNLLLSGPAGGLAAAQNIGQSLGQAKIMSFDMGGTSTDVSLIQGKFELTNTGIVGPFPVAVPMADIHTIGAGGGSIARIDKGGLLQVGPASAGADPGPACYGQGGNFATVTDANLILGRLGPNPELAGAIVLDISAAESALRPLAEQLKCSITEVAQGIIDLTNEHMSQALRVISVQRGHDPRDFSLMCFGGAGGLHLCELAESLQMTSAIVPIHGGVLSALGMLVTRPGRELVQTYQMNLGLVTTSQLAEIFDSMASKAKTELEREGVLTTLQQASLDLRYLGQSACIKINYDIYGGRDKQGAALEEIGQRFHSAHEQQFGHQMDRVIELVNCRLHVEADSLPFTLPDFINPPQSEFETSDKPSVIQRSDLRTGTRIHGPKLIVEAHATTRIKKGWLLEVDITGNLLLNKPDGESGFHTDSR